MIFLIPFKPKAQLQVGRDFSQIPISHSCSLTSSLPRWKRPEPFTPSKSTPRKGWDLGVWLWAVLGDTPGNKDSTRRQTA